MCSSAPISPNLVKVRLAPVIQVYTQFLYILYVFTVFVTVFTFWAEINVRYDPYKS